MYKIDCPHPETKLNLAPNLCLDTKYMPMKGLTENPGYQRQNHGR